MKTQDPNSNPSATSQKAASVSDIPQFGIRNSS